jgi:hypothetical protein
MAGTDAGRPALDSSRGLDRSLAGGVPRIHAAWLVVPCVAADGLMVPVLASLQGPPADVPAAVALGIVGCVLAQGNLLAAWLAWGDVPFLRRLWTHWIIAIGLYLVWLVGMGLAVGDDPDTPDVAATVALGVPLISLAAQLPLWLVRYLLGWRLVRETAEAVPPSEPPLSIRDLMLATLVVAAALALARLAPLFDNAQELWRALGVGCMVACIISSIALLPAGVLLLRVRPFSRGLFFSGLYAAGLIGLVWIAVAVKWWYDPALLAPRALYVGLSSLMFTFAATLVLTGAIARGRGYRLTSGRRRRPPS